MTQTYIPMERVARLPQWAQFLVRRLDAEIAARQERLGERDHVEMPSEIPEGRQGVGNYLDIQVVPNGDAFFVRMPHWTRGQYLRIMPQDTHIEVYSTGGSLLVQPASSNIVKITTGDWL